MNTMDILEKIFSSRHRTKLLRLFIFNPEVSFDRKEIMRRSKISSANLSKELNLLSTVGFIKSKKVSVRRASKSSSITHWSLNPIFPLTNGFRNLLNTDFLRRRSDIVKRFRNCGRIKLLVVSGIFIDDEERRVDILIVGDNLKKILIEKTIKTIESEVGRELSFSILETEDFLYRVGTSDRFVRDVFDYPHERMIDKLTF